MQPVDPSKVGILGCIEMLTGVSGPFFSASDTGDRAIYSPTSRGSSECKASRARLLS